MLALRISMSVIHKVWSQHEKTRILLYKFSVVMPKIYLLMLSCAKQEAEKRKNISLHCTKKFYGAHDMENIFLTFSSGIFKPSLPALDRQNYLCRERQIFFSYGNNI